METTRYLIGYRLTFTLVLTLLGACGAQDPESEPTVEAPLATVAGQAYSLVGVQSGKCVEIVGGSTSAGAGVQIASCDGSARQRFFFEDAGDGYYRVRNAGSNLCLDVTGSSSAPGELVVQWTCGSGWNQQWAMVDRSATVTQLVARHSGQALDVSGRGTADGTPLLQWPLSSGAANQQFQLGVASSPSTGSPSTGGSGNPASSNDSIPTSIPTASGTEIRSSTTVLPAGVHDFNNRRIGVQNPIGCDGEGQPAVFELADGATLTNVIIAGGTPGANGVVCKGNCTLQNVYWEDVCEDAATNSKDGSVVKIDKVIAMNAADKVFQHNSKGGSKTIVSNSYISNAGKVWRSCGDCSSNGGPRHLELSNVRVEGISSTVAGANENYGDTVTIRDLFVKGGYNASSDKPKICQVYNGVVKGSGTSEKLYGGKSQWNTATCNVSQGDIKSW